MIQNSKFKIQNFSSIKRYRLNAENGVAALLSVFLILSVSLIIVVGFLMFSLSEAKIARNYIKSIESYYTAEGGLEDLIYRIKNLKNYSASETLAIGNSDVSVTVQSFGINQKLITSQGKVDNIFRKVKALVKISSEEIDFYYGVQVGEGGVELKNNAYVIGNVYSNGSVKGASNTGFTGDLFVAAANSADSVKIEGDLHSYSITRSEIKGDAYYQEIDSQSLNWLNNYSQSPGTAYPGSADPEVINMPISTSTINSWKQEAESGGVYSGSCPYQPADGAVIGPLKINCDTIIEGNIKITIKGIVWVNGDLIINNNAVLVLDPSFGDLSSVIIADYPENPTLKGKIDVYNNGFICGSTGYNDDTDHCNPSNGSYLMLLSTYSGTDDDAIDISNNAEGAIFYAANGSALVHNNVNIKEVIAYKLKLDNNATVAYESGLADAKFSGGAGGAWELSNWVETE